MEDGHKNKNKISLIYINFMVRIGKKFNPLSELERQHR